MSPKQASGSRTRQRWPGRGWPARTEHEEIQEYYLRNTRRFLRWGGSGRLLAMHRKLWLPGISGRQEAFAAVNRLILNCISCSGCLPPAHGNGTRNGEKPRFIDLGCGAGGTVIWLAERSVPDAVGVSNSDQQILIARSSARQRGLDCRFIQADFHHFTSSSSYHAASAVESFSHSPDPGLFFRNTAGLLKEGGLLILVDDFIPPGHEFYGPARTWLDRFRRGWRLHSLLAVEQVVTMAGEAGFKLIENKDLTGYIRNRWWNTLPLLPLAMVRHRSPLLGNFAGGISLRCCTLRGYTRYLMLVFRLSRSPAGG